MHGAFLLAGSLSAFGICEISPARTEGRVLLVGSVSTSGESSTMV